MSWLKWNGVANFIMVSVYRTHVCTTYMKLHRHVYILKLSTVTKHAGWGPAAYIWKLQCLDEQECSWGSLSALYFLYMRRRGPWLFSSLPLNISLKGPDYSQVYFRRKSDFSLAAIFLDWTGGRHFFKKSFGSTSYRVFSWKSHAALIVTIVIQ